MHLTKLLTYMAPYMTQDDLEGLPNLSVPMIPLRDLRRP